MKKIVHLSIFVFIFASCSHQTAPKVKSPLNHLNGEHYNQNRGGLGDRIGIPVPLPGKRIKKTTFISGRLLRKQELIYAPLNHKPVILLDSDGKPVETTMSQAGGLFEFTLPLANGRYKLVVEDEDLVGQLEITVDTYEIKDLKLVVY